MKRLEAFLVGLAIVSLMPVLAGAQGFGLPGCGAASCDPEKKIGGAAGYLGYMKADKGSEINFTYKDSPVPPILLRSRSPLEGLWVGGSLSTETSESFGLLVNGWLLLPAGKTGSESYEIGGVRHRNWTVKPRWWYGDALLTVGNVGGFSVLGGVRYDFFDIREQDPDPPTLPIFPPPLVGVSTDTADLTLKSWFPLGGVQYASKDGESGFLIQVLATPVLLGRVSAKETVGGFGPARLEASGNYRSGGLIEVFTEFTKKFGDAEGGLFARYTWVNVKSDVAVDVLFGGVTLNYGTYDMSLSRSTWTVGGKVGVSF